MENNSENSIKEIVDKQRILQFLDIANKRVANLKVHIDGSNESYSSAIIDIDDKEGSISLELLRPDKGNALLHNADNADIEVFLNNSKLSWRSEVFKDDYTCIPDLFQISIPTKISYTQQRLAYRIEPTDDVTVVVSHPEIGPIHGAMVNLSVDGMAAKIPDHFIQDIDPGTFIQDCLVQLPNRDVLCSIEVRHKNIDTSMFGARFCSLSRLQQHSVAEYIAEKDRIEQRSRLYA